MVRFDPEYPFKSPAVQFVVSDKVKPPVHPVRLSLASPCRQKIHRGFHAACLHEWPCKRPACLARMTVLSRLTLIQDMRFYSRR